MFFFCAPYFLPRLHDAKDFVQGYDEMMGSSTTTELSVLMCKKIAQLTKVIYQLNTVNEDHAAEMETTKRQHKAEVNDVLRDATAKISKFKESMSSLKEMANAKAQLAQEKERFSREKERSVRDFAKILAEKEKSVRGEYDTKIDKAEANVLGLKKKFESAVKVFEETTKSLVEEKGKARQELERQKSETEQERQKKENEMAERRRYEQLFEEKRRESGEEERRLKLDFAEKMREREGLASNELKDALGKLRAELGADKEVTVAALKRENAEALKAALIAARSEASADAEKRVKKDMEDLRAKDRASAFERDKEREKVARASRQALEEKYAREKSDLEMEHARSIEELTQKIEALTNELASVKSENHKETAQRVIDLEARLKDANDREENLRKTLKATSEELTELSQKYENLEARMTLELGKRDSLLSEKEEKANLQRQSNGELQKAWDHDKMTFKAKTTDLEASLLTAEKSVKSLEEKLKKKDKDFSEATKSLEQLKLKALKEVSSKHTDAIKNKETLISKLENDLKVSHSEKSKAEAALRDKLEQVRCQLEKNMDDLIEENKAKVETLTNEKLDLEKQLEEALKSGSSETLSLKADNAKLESDLKASKLTLTRAKADQKRQAQVVDSLKNQVEELREEIQSRSQAAKKQLEQTVAALTVEWQAKVKAEVAQAQSAIRLEVAGIRKQERAEAAKEKEDLRSDLSAKLNAITELSEVRLAELDAVKAKLKNDREIYERQQKEAEAQIAALTSDLKRVTESFTAERTVAQKDAHAASAEIAAFTRDLEETKQKLANAADTFRSERTSLTERMTSLELDLTKTEATLKETRDLASKRKTSISDLEMQVKEQKTEMERRARAFSDQLESQKEAFTTTNGLQVASLQKKADNDLKRLKESLQKVIDTQKEELASEKASHKEEKEEIIQKALEKETAAASQHSAALEALSQDHAAQLDRSKKSADARHRAMLEAFEADRERQQETVAEVERAYSELQDKYQNRESRPEDLRTIQSLEEALDDSKLETEKARKDMVYYQRELVNREENFNRRFNNNPVVGLINPLEYKQQQHNKQGKQQQQQRPQQQQQPGRGVLPF